MVSDEILQPLPLDPELAATLRVAGMVGDQVLLASALAGGASEAEARRIIATLPAPDQGRLAVTDLSVMADLLGAALDAAQAPEIGLRDMIYRFMRTDDKQIEKAGLGMEAGAFVLATCLGIAVLMLVAKLNGEYHSKDGATRFAIAKGIPPGFLPVVDSVVKIIGAAHGGQDHPAARDDAP